MQCLPRLSAFLLAAVTISFAANAQDAEPDITSPALIDAGRLQFAQACVYCHGNAGSGGKAGPLARRTDLTPDYVFQTITNGKRAGSLVMPAWGESFDSPTIWSLTAYIMSLQAKP